MSKTPSLELNGVSAGYGRTTVVRDVSLTVQPGRIAALLGPNGAGKTTLLQAIAGVTSSRAGSIAVAGHDLTGRSPHHRVKAGVCLVPEGRGIFHRLTVKENLHMQVRPGDRKGSIEPAIDAFPVLGERLHQVAGTMSGGQQQMLALGRAFVTSPQVVLLDEVSMGLAPQVIDTIFEALAKLAAAGVSMLLVEQFVTRALDIADDVHLLSGGSLTYSGRPTDLDAEAVLAGYLGSSNTTPFSPLEGTETP